MLVLAAILHVPENLGYIGLVALIALESGGLPVPGETALIAAGVLASQGKLSIELVVVLAAAAAIVGDNAGYLLGRRFGRRLLVRPGGRYAARRRRILEQGERFFERHGPKAVFFGRWITGLRVWASWLSGMTRMRWPTFLAWNALGGTAWALTVGLGAYALGEAFTHALETVGPILAGLIVAALAAGWFVLHRRRHA